LCRELGVNLPAEYKLTFIFSICEEEIRVKPLDDANMGIIFLVPLPFALYSLSFVIRLIASSFGGQIHHLPDSAGKGSPVLYLSSSRQFHGSLNGGKNDTTKTGDLCVSV
jgi:hypothetical protein